MQKLNGKVYETRASLLKRYPEPVDPPPYWKMSRFSKVTDFALMMMSNALSVLVFLFFPQIPANVDTFRSDGLRNKARSYYKTDSAARQGMLGQGIYQTV